MNKICTVIVTYNRLDLLKGAIASLKAQIHPTDILVVNNGSTDGTTEYLKTVDNITVINQENVGGAGGFHTGLKYAAENGYEFAWVMDDDIIAKPDSLQTLNEAYRRLSQKEKIGFLCSTVLSAEGDTVNVPVIDLKPNPTGYPEWHKKLTEGVIKVESATFVSVFLSVEIIKEIGLPIKDFFIWGDDTEYTLRISRKYACYLVGKSIITHLRNGGTLSLRNINDPKRISMYRLFLRNNLYNMRKYSSKKKLLIFCGSFGLECISFLMKGKFSKANVIFKGLRQGWFFNPNIEFANIKSK